MNNRYDFVYLFDCKDGNPNGDPDAGNAPRIDPQNMHGLVSDVCLKRKIRDYVSLTRSPQERYRIYVSHHGVLELVHRAAYETLGLEAVVSPVESPEGEERRAPYRKKRGRQSPHDLEKIKRWICEHYFDVRTFGAVMSLKIFNAGQVRGPVQISFSRSVDPILPLDLCVTRIAVANEKEKETKDTTMGRKNIIPYGLYRTHGFISAHLANQTGFNGDDLALLWESFLGLFEHDRSATRGIMAPQKLIVFKHSSMLGNAPAHKLFERISVRRKPDVVTARSFSDYSVEIDRENLSQEVEILELL